ncbi:MAG: hypothetical protein LBE97_01390, partial [Holosporales bacterium]|nr:hypothetical protein [Holosporales bacterium]
GDISGFSGVIDVDESYFGGIRKGKKGKDAAVFNNQKQGKSDSVIYADCLVMLCISKHDSNSVFFELWRKRYYGHHIYSYI